MNSFSKILTAALTTGLLAAASLAHAEVAEGTSPEADTRANGEPVAMKHKAKAAAAPVADKGDKAVKTHKGKKHKGCKNGCDKDKADAKAAAGATAPVDATPEVKK